MARNPLILSGFCLFLFAGIIRAQTSGSNDPVEELRRELQVFSGQNLPEAFWVKRQARLNDRVQALRGAAQLHQALLLEEWPDPQQSIAPGQQRVDEAMRKSVAARLFKTLEPTTVDAEKLARIVCARLLAELGWRHERPRGALPPPAEYSEQALPLLAKLASDGHSEVRKAAYEALARSLADPLAVIASLRNGLGDKEPSVRLAVAEALAQYQQNQQSLVMIPVAGRRGWGTDRIADLLSGALAAANQGLTDDDANVRSACWSAVRISFAIAEDWIPDPISPNELQIMASAPSGGPAAELLKSSKDVFGFVAALAKALTDFRHRWERSVGADAAERRAAVAALEQMSRIHERWRRRAVSLSPAVIGGLERPLPGPLHEVFRNAEAGLQTCLGDPEARVRIGVVHILENLGSDAPLAHAVKAAQAGDKYVFVRWGLARFLAGRCPKESDSIAPILARYLTDAEPAVRLTALLGLERCGNQAKTTAAAVGKLSATGTVEQRVQALRTLRALGSEACRAEVGTLVKILAVSDPELRIEAAHALKQVQPLPAPARQALADALIDAHDEVRRAAAGALVMDK